MDFVGKRSISQVGPDGPEHLEGLWGVWLWSGRPWQEPATGEWRAQALKRAYYRTRREAEQADISQGGWVCYDGQPEAAAIRAAASAFGKLGGAVRGGKKATSARENGKLGGRPRKEAP